MSDNGIVILVGLVWLAGAFLVWCLCRIADDADERAEIATREAWQNGQSRIQRRLRDAVERGV